MNGSEDKKIFAVDFDGVLVQDEFPRIGPAREEVVEAVRSLKAQGHYLVLWTSRRDERLEEARAWCESQNLEFDSYNSGVEHNIKEYGGDTRKIHADWYIDDKNMSIEDFIKESKKEETGNEL
jgi:hypothetical protein